MKIVIQIIMIDLDFLINNKKTNVPNIKQCINIDKY